MNTNHAIKLLNEALSCLNEELGSSGEDEVRTHPILKKHKKVYEKIEKFLNEQKYQFLEVKHPKRYIVENGRYYEVVNPIPCKANSKWTTPVNRE